MIFFALLFVIGGALCIYAFVWGTSGERVLITVFGVVGLLLGGGYVFPQLFVIRNFPKYPKLRRIMFNSDIYFTDSTSNEYRGGSRTIQGRRSKAAFELVTSFTEMEKGMGNKKPIRYTVYLALMLFISVLGLVDLFVMPLLFENGIIFSNMSDNTFLFCYLFVACICAAFAIFFLNCAFKEGKKATKKNLSWSSELHFTLVDISVRKNAVVYKNNKKLKYWYDKEQLQQIEGLVKSASPNAELKLITKENRLASFEVIDSLNQEVVFKGWFA
jgi:hypothetical protein